MSDGDMMLLGLLALLAVPALSGTSGDPATSRGPRVVPIEYPGKGAAGSIASTNQDGVPETENVLDSGTLRGDVVEAYVRRYAPETSDRDNATGSMKPYINNSERYIIEPGTDMNSSETPDSRDNVSSATHPAESASDSSHPGVNTASHPGVNTTSVPVNLWARFLQSTSAPSAGCELVEGNDLYICGTQQLQVEGERTTVACDFSAHSPLDCNNLPPSRSVAGVSQLYVRECPLPHTLALACVAGTAHTLVLQDVPGTVTADNVRGLETEYIYFMAARGAVHELPVEAIRALPRLRRFRFQQGSTIPLSPGMFPPSPLEFLEVGTSGITALPRAAFSALHNLTTLSLFSNNISYIHPEAFQGVRSLRELVLDGNPLPTLPRAALPAPLRALHLQRTQLALLQEEQLRGLDQLQVVKVSSMDPEQFPLRLAPRALAHLPALRDVSIERAGVTSLPADLFLSSTALVNISLQYNSISSLPSPLWAGLQSLERLNLAHNNISAFAPDTLALRALLHLDLSWNRIAALPDRAFKHLPSLRRLSLSHNLISQVSYVSFTGAGSLRALSLSHNALHWAPSDIQDAWGWESSPLNMLTELQELDLSHNSISVLYSDWRLVLRHLVQLDLSHNNLTELTAADLQFVPWSPLLVDVSYNNITSVQPRQEEPGEHAGDPVTFQLGHNPFHCDCMLYEFITQIQSGSPRYLAEGAACASPAPLAQVPLPRVPPAEVTCPLPEVAPCHCVLRPAYVRVDCVCPDISHVPDISGSGAAQMSLRVLAAPSAAEWRRLPRTVSHLSLTHTRLTHTPDTPHTVTHMDLTHNNIATIPPHILQRNITLKLANNAISCDCSATDNVILIQKYAAKILDYANVTCSDGTYIKLKDANTICDVYKSAISATLIAVSLILAACCLALAYIYRVEMQVLMYRHKFCLFLLPKERDDRDKPYDVFVSFTHEDEKFVLNEILPKLTEYVLHVQGRDWEVGGTIPEQIHRSVEQSRRTLIILSADFLNSRWASEVCRSVHGQATSDKRTRAVILLTDVKRKQLDKDTKTFLSLSTFVKYNHFLYVDKLKYALPRKQYNNSLDVNNCNRLENNMASGGGKLWNSSPLQVVKDEEGNLLNLANVKQIS